MGKENVEEESVRFCILKSIIAKPISTSLHPFRTRHQVREKEIDKEVWKQNVMNGSFKERELTESESSKLESALSDGEKS